RSSTLYTLSLHDALPIFFAEYLADAAIFAVGLETGTGFAKLFIPFNPKIMETITIKVIADPEFLPVYATAQAAGMDLHACIEAPIVLKPGERKLLPTGIKMA